MRPRGFTLMETLVVLVIVSLTTAALFQMLGTYRIARERVAAQAAGIDRRALVQAWFTDSIHGLVAVDGAPLRGTTERLVATTLNPLFGTPGAPADVEWAFKRDGDRWALEYSEDGQVRWSAPIEAAEAPGFLYYAANGETSRQWPPALGAQTPLPASVALLRDGQVELASVLGPLEPRKDVFEMERE
ncbi:type II secretion system protein [Cognatilysobacter segetis]|uniref:type II secretion system protein n=1 Tax=Cognatilysobacter segetis TaxID=2492394 RepID=UPI00105C86FA|nr:type II secretion system protein [Lysobacter segetis]